MRQATKPDLSIFDEANVKTKGGKKLPWDERRILIEKQFPSVNGLNFDKAFDRDVDLFAWIMQDILKADGALPGRSGPKPAVTYKAGMMRFRQLMGDDYTVLPFSEALEILSSGLSVTTLARKVGLSRSQVFRLLKGVCEPTGWEMEQVARAFKKAPGYFAEYRKAVVVAALAMKLEANPEATVKYWRELAVAEAG